jgi:hypothetical protein
MNTVLRVGNILSFIIGCLGVLLTYQAVDAESDFLLFMDIQNFLILVPSFSLAVGAFLFMMYDFLNSKRKFSVVTLITMTLVGPSYYFFFKDVYSYIGLSILGFELFLLVTLYFYICAFLKYFINKRIVYKLKENNGNV